MIIIIIVDLSIIDRGELTYEGVLAAGLLCESLCCTHGVECVETDDIPERSRAEHKHIEQVSEYRVSDRASTAHGVGRTRHKTVIDKLVQPSQYKYRGWGGISEHREGVE